MGNVPSQQLHSSPSRDSFLRYITLAFFYDEVERDYARRVSLPPYAPIHGGFTYRADEALSSGQGGSYFALRLRPDSIHLYPLPCLLLDLHWCAVACIRLSLRTTGSQYRPAAVHLGEAVRWRTWWLLPTAVLCGIGEIAGWGGRLWSTHNVCSDGYMMQ
jgi:hypothetical protein